MSQSSGIFITFEGSEGSGKSTQIQFVQKLFKSKNKDFVLIREPGGVKISEKIRAILLDNENSEMGQECETLLYMAARAQLVKEVLVPALRAGKIVLCDRFLDSTLVYQGYGCGVDIPTIEMIGQFATQNIQPDLTLLFDIDIQKGFSRISRTKDRIENRELDYHNQVRKGYQELARKYSQRIKMINADQPKDIVSSLVEKYISQIVKL